MGMASPNVAAGRAFCWWYRAEIRVGTLRFAHSMPLHSDAAGVLQKALIFPGSRPREGGAGSRGNDDYVVIQRIPK